MILTIVAMLLAAIGLLLAILVFGALRSFRNLSAKRLEIYTAYLGLMHENLHGLRRDKPIPEADENLAGQFGLIASYPTMDIAGRAFAAFSKLKTKKNHHAPFSEISAAEELAEKSLVDLNVAMRTDLTLAIGNGRFPRAEFFRSRRGLRE